MLLSRPHGTTQRGRQPSVQSCLLGFWELKQTAHFDFSTGGTIELVSFADFEQQIFSILFVSACHCNSLAKSASCSTPCISSGIRWIFQFRIGRVKNGYSSLLPPSHCRYVQFHCQFLQTTIRSDLDMARCSCPWED